MIFLSHVVFLAGKNREEKKTQENSLKVPDAPSTWKTVKDMFQQNNTSLSAVLQHSLEKSAHTLEKWEERGNTFMSLNVVVLFARKLWYWVWLTYPTHSDQILLYVAETYITWLPMVRKVFWTAELHMQTWWFLSNFWQELLWETQSAAKNSKISSLGQRHVAPSPTLSNIHPKTSYYQCFLPMKGELRLFTVVNHSTSYSLANIFSPTVFLFCNIAHISSHSLFSSLLNKQ